MVNNEEKWKVEVVEKKIEEPQIAAERIKVSRTKKLMIGISIFVIAACMIVGAVYSGHDKKDDTPRFDKLMEAGDFNTIKYELNTFTDEQRQLVKDYYESNLSRYNETGSEELYRKLSIYTTAFLDEYEDFSEFRELSESKETYDLGVENFDKGAYVSAKECFAYVIKEDTLYEKACEYIKKIDGMKQQELVINVWYTSTDSEKNISRMEDEFIRSKAKEYPMYNIKFNNTFVENKELSNKVIEDKPDVIFPDDYYEFNDYSCMSYTTHFPVLVYNSDYLDKADVESIENILAKTNESCVSQLYIPLNDLEIFSTFLMIGSTDIDYYDYDLNNFGIYGTEAGVAGAIENIRSLKYKVYTENDGIELMKQGKIAAAIVDYEYCEEIEKGIGDKICYAKLPLCTINDEEQLIGGVNFDTNFYVRYDFPEETIIREFANLIYDVSNGRESFEDYGIISKYSSLEDNTVIEDEHDLYSVALGQLAYINYIVQDKILYKNLQEMSDFIISSESKDEVEQYVMQSLKWLVYVNDQPSEDLFNF